MASPTLDLICCDPSPSTIGPPLDNDSWHIATMYTNTTLPPTTTTSLPTFKKDFEISFNVISILTASLSIMGAIYTLIPKRGVYRRRRTVVTETRQRGILTWLAMTDLMACLGIFIFAIVRLSDLNKEPYQGKFQSDALRWFCIVATAWIQYFYICTYFWTFSYALDVYFMLTNRNHPKLQWFYGVVSFLIPLALVITGEVFLYQTSQFTNECAPKRSAWRSMIPHYLAMYVPMVFVMIANPILYWHSFKRVGPLLMASGMYTDKERKIKQQIQVKFLRIVLVFYVCWTANLINVGILLYKAIAFEDGQEHPMNPFNTFSEFFWICMAILNPLQAFLNALVYWGPAGCRRTTTDEDRNLIQDSASGESDIEVLRSTPTRNNWANERSPLLDGLGL